MADPGVMLSGITLKLAVFPPASFFAPGSGFSRLTVRFAGKNDSDKVTQAGQKNSGRTIHLIRHTPGDPVVQSQKSIIPRAPTL
jgi:hypothetical protein